MRPQTHRPETKTSRPDRNFATSPEPQKLLQPFPPTPKQQIPIASQLSQINEKTPPKPSTLNNPEAPEQELIVNMNTNTNTAVNVIVTSPRFLCFLPFELFERKFELAIKNKQNKGNLPSRKIDIYLNKESLAQNDFYAVKTIECDSMDTIGKKIQSLMVFNYLNNTDICINLLYYTIGFYDKKTGIVKKKNEAPSINFSMIMELAETNLADEIYIRKNKKNPFSKYEIYTLAENLSILVNKLEKLKIAHGNLKPENVLLIKGKYKLADFNGMIYEKNIGCMQSFINTKYIPFNIKSKLSENQVFDINYYKLDVFSLGAIILECCEGNETDENAASFSQEKINERINKISNKFDHWFITILQNMLESDESFRNEIGNISERFSKYYEEIQKMQFEVKKNKQTNQKKEIMSKTTSNSMQPKKKEDFIKRNEKTKQKNEILPRKMPNRSITPESPLKELENESRYSSLEKKKKKDEITHSKVTSYVSPRAQKDLNRFKFPVKTTESKNPKQINKNIEETEPKDLYKDFLEKLNKINPKLINFSLVLSYFTLDQLHYDKNVFYQKYVQFEAKFPKKIVSENKRKDGKIVRFYSDHSQEILFNNGARKQIFPDSYSIINFLNNDIKQTFPYDLTIYYYADSQTTQITFEKIGINIYQFKNEQIELHHADGRIEIRLADGTEKHLLITNNKNN